MDEAEEACCQALHARPANAKALFRRGQARLALGRTIEAAGDFSEVCLMEPNNAEATRMLRRAQGRGDPAPLPVGNSPHERESERSKAAPLPSTPSSEEALPRETTRDRSSNNGAMVDVKPEKFEVGGDAAEQSRVESSDISTAPASGSSFMVSGWLDSAERKQGGHPRENDIHRRRLGGGSADHSESARPGAVEGAGSVSRQVSHLSLAQKGAQQEQPVASGTAAAAVQAEWSRLQAEEDARVQESLRRWSTGGAPRHGEEKTTKKAIAKGRLVDANGVTPKEKTARDKMKSKAAYGRGSKEADKTSEWWASLEEEESRVREAFRSKLGVGEKLSCKEKVKEKKKNKKNKRKENNQVVL